MENVTYINEWSIKNRPLPESCALIQFADCEEMLPTPLTEPAAKLKLFVNDCIVDGKFVTSPSTDDAEAIWRFVKENESLSNFVIQCAQGIGRSQATAAAILKLVGAPYRHILSWGTYNIRLFRLLCESASLPPEPEPWVGIAVRTKYVDTTAAYSLRLQRYRNIDIAYMDIDDPDEAKFWGNGQRNILLEEFLKNPKIEWFGFANDDNYMTPGFVEQMIFATQETGALGVSCDCVHKYFGWSANTAKRISHIDLNAWLFHRSVVQKWDGIDIDAEPRWIRSCLDVCKDRVVHVPRPLFVKN